VLHLKNISFSYDGKKSVFKNVSLSVKKGRIVGIVGPSGAGKSSLLRSVAGTITLDQGEVVLDGSKIQSPHIKLVPGDDEVGFVNQSFELDDYYTCEENILRALLHLSKEQRKQFCDQLIHLMGLEDVRGVQGRHLSGGEQQRLSIAAALAKEPKVLLLDEPFVHLDVHLRKKLGKYIKDLCDVRGMMILLVTHEGEEALSWSDEIYCMFDGKITHKYNPQTAYYKPRSLKEGRFFGELNSVRISDKQVLFRPKEFQLEGKKKNEVDVKFLYAEFRGHYTASYFKLNNGREVVLYSDITLNTITKIYV
jgi:iron(III) transport system ATP-binding protein